MGRLIILFAFTGISILKTYCQENTFEIKVTVNKEYVGNYLDFYPSKGNKFPRKITDTIFTISGYCNDKFESCKLQLQQSDALSNLDFFISSGKMELKINRLSSDTLYDIEFKNFPFQNEQEAYLALTYKDEKKWRRYYNTMISPLPRKKVFASKRDSLESICGEMREAIDYKTLGFINAHPNSFLSYKLFADKIMRNTIVNADSLATIFHSLNVEYQQTASGKQIDSTIQHRKAFSLGSTFPKLNFKTDKYKEFSLSDLTKNGYVLLCYWASWCGPCRRNIPKLKSIFESYSTKGLQIISISIDKNEIDWKKALEVEQMPWLQTCDLPKYIVGVKTVNFLYYPQVPQYYLLDKNNKIIYNDFQVNETDAYDMLKKILSNQ
jgi:peroxiredoxin